MKRKRYNLTSVYSLLLIALFLVSITSCKDDEDNAPVKIKTVNTSDISYTSLIVNAEVTQGNPTERGICWNTTGEPTINDEIVRSGSGKGIYETRVDNLDKGTVHYFRAYALAGSEVVYGETLTALTYMEGIPVVGITYIHKATYKSVFIDLRVVTDGAEVVGERGICWSESPNPTVEDYFLTSGEGLGAFSVELTNLRSQVKYYARPYVKHADNIVYGHQREFVTAGGIKFNVIKAHDIYSYSASVTINNTFYVPVLEQGFIYLDAEEEEIEPSLENGVIIKLEPEEEKDLIYIMPFDELRPAKTYYMRSYVITDENGVNNLYYGNVFSFKTRELAFGFSTSAKYRKFAYDPEVITEGQSERYTQVFTKMNEAVKVGHNPNLLIYYWDLIWEQENNRVKFHVSYKNVVVGSSWGATYYYTGKYDSYNASLHTSNLVVNPGNPTSLRNGIIKKGEPYVTYMNDFFEYFKDVKVEWASPETNEYVKIIPINPYEEGNYLLGKVSNP